MGVILFVISTWIEFWLNWTDVWFFSKERESFSNCPSYFQRLKKVFGVVVRNVYRNRVFSIRFKIFPCRTTKFEKQKKIDFAKWWNLSKIYIYIHVLYIRTEKFFQVIIYLYLLSKSLFTICIILTVFFNA